MLEYSETLAVTPRAPGPAHGNKTAMGAPEVHGSRQDEMAEVEAEADKAAAEERSAAESAARLACLQAAGLEVWSQARRELRKKDVHAG